MILWGRTYKKITLIWDRVYLNCLKLEKMALNIFFVMLIEVTIYWYSRIYILSSVCADMWYHIFLYFESHITLITIIWHFYFVCMHVLNHIILTEKASLQGIHSKGFSPVSIRSCLGRLPYFMNVLSQNLHWWGLALICIEVSLLTSIFSENVLPQWLNV